MGTYMLLYSGGRLPKTEEETKAVADAWGTLLAGIGDALVDGNRSLRTPRVSRPTVRSQMVPSAR